MSAEDVNEEGYIDGQEQTPGGPNAFAVEGVPAWWDRMGHQQPAFSTVCSTPGGAMYFEHPNATTADMRPMAAFSHQPVLYQGQHVSVNNKSDSGDGTTEGNQLQAAAGAVFQSQNVDQVMPHTQLELGPSMGPASYTYADPYYGGIFTTYDAQAISMMHPQILGMHQSRMPLPLEIAEEEPVYVNAKQYNGIMRRRQSRAKAESENKLVKARKPYLHESRHLHAIRRARGCGGRFLNTKADEMKAKPDSFTALEGSSIPTEHEHKKFKHSETFKGCAL